MYKSYGMGWNGQAGPPAVSNSSGTYMLDRKLNHKLRVTFFE